METVIVKIDEHGRVTALTSASNVLVLVLDERKSLAGQEATLQAQGKTYLAASLADGLAEVAPKEIATLCEHLHEPIAEEERDGRLSRVQRIQMRNVAKVVAKRGALAASE